MGKALIVAWLTGLLNAELRRLSDPSGRVSVGVGNGRAKSDSILLVKCYAASPKGKIQPFSL